MTKEIYLELEYESDSYNNVIEYLSTFPEIDNYLVKDWDSKKKRYPLYLPYDNYEIIYQSSKLDITDSIQIKHLYLDSKPVGLDSNVSCLTRLFISSRNKDFLLDFLEQSKEYCQDNIKDTIKIYNWCVDHFIWDLVTKLPKRDIKTVFLDNTTLQDLELDIENFLQEEEDYNKYGIPYKRNYLLDGLPGTGKTSTIFAIASKLDMNISIINFGPKLDDYGFNNAIAELSNDTILVLEDIDSLFIDRINSDENKSNISFSGILNILDGIARKHKLIIFMTTNHKDRLDPALIRPGRIDYNIHFNYSTKNQIEQIMNYYFNDTKLTQEFISKLKNKKITTCILQKFLFENRKNKNNILIKLNTLDDLIKDYSKSSNLYI